MNERTISAPMGLARSEHEPQGAVASRYESLVASKAIERDAAQVRLVAALDRLLAELGRRKRASKGSALGWLFGRKEDESGPTKGLYIWGGVGRGKTMLMDIFHEAAPAPKRRVHFHGFLSDVHERIHAHRQAVKNGQAKGDEPIAPVAEELASEAKLLCFDEFTVTDIADAMILGRLFDALFRHGVTIVATSNVEPDRLYEGGLNRALFMPFLETFQERVAVFRLDARTDFRLEKLGGTSVFHTPADEAAARALDDAFQSLTGKPKGNAGGVRVKGREVTVPEEAGGVARFGFADLCAKPLGAADYMAIATAFHTVIVAEIPVMDETKRNEAKRFITLIDTFYDSHVKLIASAEAEAAGLYKAKDGREVFEFERTVSRLIEMRSDAYLSLPHGQGDSTSSGSSTGLAET